MISFVMQLVDLQNWVSKLLTQMKATTVSVRWRLLETAVKCVSIKICYLQERNG